MGQVPNNSVCLEATIPKSWAMPYCGEMLATVLQTSHTAGSVHWETFKCLNSIPQLCRHFFFFLERKEV
jgi:hypothetical protein